MTEFDYLYCYINMIIDQESQYSEFVFNENFNFEEYNKRKCGAY